MPGRSTRIRFRRARIASLILLCVSIAVALFLGEWMVRLAAPQQLVLLRPDIWRPDSTLGHCHRENADTRVNLGAGTVRFVTDANGYRIDPTLPTAVAPQVSILMLGDSFIEALGMEESEAIPGRTRALLEHDLAEDVRIDNAAVGGWSPDQYLLEARRALARRRYDLGVVFLFVGNDIVSQRFDAYPPRPYATRFHFRWPHGLSRHEIIVTLLYPANDALETRSHLYVLGKEALRVPLAKVGLTARQPIPPIFVRAESSAACWQVTADICSDVAKAFAAQGAPTLFVLLPTNYQVDAKVFDEYVRSFGTDPRTVDLSLPNERLRAELAARELTLLDPLDAMRRATARDVRLYPKADIHMNAAGHDVVSQFLSASILKMLKPG